MKITTFLLCSVVAIILPFNLWAKSSLDPQSFNILDREALEKNYQSKATDSGNLNTGDFKDSLYQQIADEMNAEYEHIGKREAARVLGNRNGVTGGLNSIGFTYRRAFVDFSISADRNLAPDLFDDKRWIVTDTFSIFIDASKVLGRLSDSKVIDISKENLAAFAGIVFKRSFTWVHFANSYEEGLTTQFNKLFLPFAALNVSTVKKMGPNEMIFKEDAISVKAGALASAPLYTGISASAGVLARFSRLARVEVVSSLPKNETDLDIMISSEKTKSESLGLSMSIQADFLKILRLTLLSYDYSYELSSSYKIYLKFKQHEIQEMVQENPVAVEISRLLKNKEGDLETLSPYVISEEKKIAELVAHKYNFLLLGGKKSSKTQQIEVTTNGKVKNFFRHYYEKMKYTEDFLSRLFASVIYALTSTDASAAKLASETKRVTLEYDSEKNLLENQESLNIESDTQKLSLTFSAEFMTRKSTGRSGKKYRERAMYLLERYSGVDPLAVGMIEREYLQAPFLISGQYQVNVDGVRHLNALSVAEAFDHFSGLCDEYPKKKWFNFRNLFDHCKHSMEESYVDYLKNLSHERITADQIKSCEKKSLRYVFNAGKKRAFLKNCLSDLSLKEKTDWVEVPLWNLKELSTLIVNNSNSKVHYFNLFGVENVFFHGSFDAVTATGSDFTTSFHEGAFKGLGVVDHYMRLENLRAPASVVVDQ